MSEWRTSVRSSKAVVLGASVCCDGFYVEAAARVQTHVHSDHTEKFESSLGVQQVYALKGTRDLLIADKDATLDVHVNFHGVGPRERVDVPGGAVYLVDSGHMLGSAQVLFVHEDGYRTGYSGDFTWPLEDVIEVNELVVDSTYGAARQVRRFDQGEAEEAFVTRVLERVGMGPVYVRAYGGTLQRAAVLLGDVCRFPLILSGRQHKDALVYLDHGYAMPPCFIDGSVEAREARAEGRYVLFEGAGDKPETNRQGGYHIRLSAMYTSVDEPLVDFTENACAVAISNHADFRGTVDYVRATGATRVVTDNVRGAHAVELATALSERLGVEARASVSNPAESRGWGQ